MKGIKTYLFIIILCGSAALILSTISTSLAEKQRIARDSYKNKELLKAANLLPEKATYAAITAITNEKITPMLTDSQGNTFTFAQKNINYTKYLEEGAKKGYHQMPLKLFYQIKGGGMVIPVNGFGLWDAIFGFIGIHKDGIHIIGISWYDQKETPGLGAEIENPKWQALFIGKTLFKGTQRDKISLSFAPKEMIKLLPPQDKKFTIDAISGATITTDGVQSAIERSLTPYLPLLQKMQQASTS